MFIIKMASHIHEGSCSSSEEEFICESSEEEFVNLEGYSNEPEYSKADVEKMNFSDDGNKSDSFFITANFTKPDQKTRFFIFVFFKYSTVVQSVKR